MKSLFGVVSFRHPDIGDVDRTFEALRAVGYGFSFGDYIRSHRNLAGPNVIANVEFAQTLSVEEVGRAHAAQAELFRNFDAFYKDVDILICPASSVAPYSIENVYVRAVEGVTMGSYIRWVAIAYAVTLSTHPSTVIPAGLGHTGLPFGLQIVGRHRGDVATMAAAAAIEAALAKDPKLARPKPDIAKLSKAGLPTAARSIPAGWTAHVR